LGKNIKHLSRTFFIKIFPVEGRFISKVLISIVSHGQGDLIKKLLHDLDSNLKNSKHSINVVVTINISEDETFLSGFSNLLIHTIRNKHQKGYGENHNYSFKSMDSDFFLVLNPDLRIRSNLIDSLIPYFKTCTGVVAPRVLNSFGDEEDSCRKFPTMLNMIKRKLLKYKKNDYVFLESKPHEVEWVAGMFMLFESSTYGKIKGFDERYYMYLEDADICRRLRKNGLSTIYIPKYEIIHDARRASRKNFKYLIWHLKSMLRFLFKI
jgi:GT2 family glycosyltransferase